jgi:hypothetical protein
MSDSDLADLRERAAQGDRDAVDELVELAGERGDLEELRRLADAGSSDATDELVQLAGEREDLEELRRLAEAGSSDAADILEELRLVRGQESDEVQPTGPLPQANPCRAEVPVGRCPRLQCKWLLDTTVETTTNGTPSEARAAAASTTPLRSQAVRGPRVA